MRAAAYAVPATFWSAGALAAPLQPADRRALKATPQAFSAAWARGSGEELGASISEEADFVIVGRLWPHGRCDIALYHDRSLEGHFRGSANTPLGIRVTPVRDDLAFVRWSWRIAGDRNPDGSARPPLVGLMSRLAGNHLGKWLVTASQNSNGGPGDAPERTGLERPIRLPPNEPQANATRSTSTSTISGVPPTRER